MNIGLGPFREGGCGFPSQANSRLDSTCESASCGTLADQSTDKVVYSSNVSTLGPQPLVAGGGMGRGG